MNLDKLRVNLVELGMTEREAKLYIAMLSRTESTPAELHRLSGIVRNKTYETLEQMVQRGFCVERREGRKKFYRTIPPGTLRDALRRQWQQEMEQKVSTLEAKEGLFSQLEKLATESNEQDQILDKIEIIRNSNHINARLIELARTTQQEMLSFSRSPYVSNQSPSFRDEQNRVQADALARGVKQKSLYMYEKETWDWLPDMVIDRCESEGEDARIADYLPLKMIIFDKKTVVMHMPSFPGEAITDFTVLVIDDPGFVSMCLMNFDFIWQQSKPYEMWKAEHQAKKLSLVDE